MGLTHHLGRPMYSQHTFPLSLLSHFVGCQSESKSYEAHVFYNAIHSHPLYLDGWLDLSSVQWQQLPVLRTPPALDSCRPK